MERRICSFCNSEIEPGTGRMFVRDNASVFYFCSSKCERNMNLGRNPRKVGWVAKKK